ncbi:MAG: FMN-binding protein [Clostridiales bacterium]|nr:FMN-binding protein [Clostridiales bacterium]
MRKIVPPALILCLFCAVAALLLALTNLVTVERIAAAALEAEERGREAVMDTAASFEERELLVEGERVAYYEALDAEGDVTGYVFTTTANGYGGVIRVMTGVFPDGTVSRIEILEADDETPGLGLNVMNDSFQEQFAGLFSGFAVEKNQAGDNAVQAVTGATISSSAAGRAVQEALDLFEQAGLGGEPDGE